MSLVVLVGNPREGSRTRGVAVEAALAVGERVELPAPHDVIDLAALGPHLLSPIPSADVEVALELVTEASVLVVASPTYKGTYTGLLKAFLDRLPPRALAKHGRAAAAGHGGDPAHSLAVEVHLRPLLVELGATVPTPGLAVLESRLPDLPEILAGWAERVAPQASIQSKKVGI
ncbi:NADPH-dependent FMN reductase [Nonomuraea ferruginea]